MVTVLEYTTFAPSQFINLLGDSNRNAAGHTPQRLVAHRVDDEVQMIAEYCEVANLAVIARRSRPQRCFDLLEHIVPPKIHHIRPHLQRDLHRQPPRKLLTFDMRRFSTVHLSFAPRTLSGSTMTALWRWQC